MWKPKRGTRKRKASIKRAVEALLALKGTIDDCHLRALLEAPWQGAYHGYAER